MNDRLQLVSTWAAEHHEIVSGEQLTAFGVTSSLRYQWVSRGLLQRVGHGSFRWACAPTTWESSLAAGLADLRGIGLVGGRAAARQLGLDSFAMAPAEVVVARSGRHRAPSVLVRSTDWPFAVGDGNNLETESEASENRHHHDGGEVIEELIERYVLSDRHDLVRVEPSGHGEPEDGDDERRERNDGPDAR